MEKVQNVKMRKPPKSIKLIDKVLLFVEEGVSITLFSAMVIMVLINVTFRYFLKVPLFWGEELARYLMVIGLYYAVSICVRESRHMGISVFVDVLPRKLRMIIEGIILVLTAVGYAAITNQYIRFTKTAIKIGSTTPTLLVPYWVLYLLITITMALCVIRCVMVFMDKFFYAGALLSDEVIEEGKEGEEL